MEPPEISSTWLGQHLHRRLRPNDEVANQRADGHQ